MANKVNRKQTTRERAEAARALQAAQAAQARRRRTAIIAGAVLLVVVVGVGVWWQATRTKVDVSGGATEIISERLPDGIAVGAADGSDAPVVDIYLDFLCPHCAEFEEIVGDTIGELAADGTARFVIHPVTLLDPVESARSAAAFGCSAGTEDALGFEAALLENQGGGFSTDRLVEIAAGAGLNEESFVQCVRDETEADWAADVEAARTERGVTGTPTIFVDGEQIPLDTIATAEDFRAAVLNAA